MTATRSPYRSDLQRRSRELVKTVTRFEIDEVSADILVSQIMAEVDHRRCVLEAAVETSERAERYTATVVSFVQTINSGLFQFIDLLDHTLRGAKVGHAKLVIRDEQPDLLRHMHASLDDRVKHFALLRADLEVVLRYVAEDREYGTQAYSGTVLFLPHGGAIDWAHGDREYFRSHRENAFGDARFGDPEFLDLVSAIGIPRRGGESRSGSIFREEPEVLVLRRVCKDGEWPGWREP